MTEASKENLENDLKDISLSAVYRISISKEGLAIEFNPERTNCLTFEDLINMKKAWDLL